MIFLAPAAFWALALAIPITVLYLRREQARRLAVSNMVLWSGSARRLRESGGWQRLRHPLSLLLQLAFLALLVLALARPLLPPLGGPLVLVLDRSASMGAVEAGSSRISQAAAALAHFVHPGAGPFTLVATGTPPEILAAGSTEPEDIRRLLAAAQPAQSQLNPRPALDMARSIAGAQGGRVIFATDGVWSEETPAGGLEGVELVVVGAPGPVNAGLVALAASRSPGDPEEVVVLAGHGSSAAPPPAATLRLSANGRLVEAREIAAGASSPVFRQWALRLPESAKLAASLDTRDALSADNSAEIEVPAAERLRVVIVSPPNRALEAVFAAMAKIEVVRVWPPESIAYGDPEAVYIFAKAVPPPNFQAAGILLIEPEDGGFFGKREGGLDWRVPYVADSSSPLLRHLRAGNFGPVHAGIYAPAPGARVDLVSESGSALIFSDWRSRPRWTALAFDPSNSAMAASPAFPVLMSEILEGLAGSLVPAVAAPGLSPCLTALERHAGLPEASAAGTTPPLAAGLEELLLILGLAWLLLESWTCHRRITV